MKVIDWRNRVVAVAEGEITRVKTWGIGTMYGVSTDNGYLYLITKEEIEELYKVTQ